MKSLAVPIGVALLSLIGSYLLSEQQTFREKQAKALDDRQKKREEELEELRRRRAEQLEDRRRKRAERLESLKQLLSRVWVIAEKHYLPIGSAVLTLEWWYSKWKKQSDEGLEPIFASLLVLRFRDRELSNSVGGWILQDRKGEKLIDDLWNDFRELCEERLDEILLQRLLNDLGDKPQVAGLLERYGSRGETAAISAERWKELRAQFRVWVADEPSFEAARLLLESFRVLLLIEINRLYAPLYDLQNDFVPTESDIGFKDLLAQCDKMKKAAQLLSEERDSAERHEGEDGGNAALASRLNQRADDLAEYLGRNLGPAARLG
jgi:hypothetical protein